MLEKDNQSDSWRKTLKFISNCPVCKALYNVETVKILDTHSHAGGAEAKFVHFFCDNCRTNFIATIMMMAKGISTVGMITDLSFDDVEKFYHLPPFTVDELIEARQFINNKNFNI